MCIEILKSKYLNPFAYFRKARLLGAKFLLLVGVSLRVTTKIDNFKIKFVATSYKEYVLRAQASYVREAVTMCWLRTIVGETEVVYDVGANVGAYSLYAGYKLQHNGGLVYSFEPAFTNFPSLCRNIEINGLNKTMIPYPLAFGKATSEGKLFLRSTVTGDAMHGLLQPESEGNAFDSKFTQGVYITSIDEFSSNSDILFPNHIKIDVDGFELEIVLGMKSVLNDGRLKSVMIEINADVSGDKIIRLITDAGFQERMSEQWGKKNSFNKLFVRC